MFELNENHQRKLLTTCQYIDGLLTESAWRMMPDSQVSPLRTYTTDATAEQIRITQQQLGLLRKTMADILRESDIVIPAPQISTLWAFRTSLMEAGEVAFDLQARFMSSYGTLTPEARQRLNEISARLVQQIECFTLVFDNLTKENPRAPQHESETP
ncbi:MAG: hypothetical protein ACP5QA_03390 [Phycisphaerae bacterium]